MTLAPALPLDTDRLIHSLVGALELETSVFHVGQYCGRWRASTAGRALASFHLVLRGHCDLHLDGETQRLAANDAVFFLRDVPHHLAAEQNAAIVEGREPMRPLQPVTPDGTGLACGFFQFRGAWSELLVGSFPDYLVLRTASAELAPLRSLFDLILAEADDSTLEPSPLIARLTELLFFYAIRHFARQDTVAASLWAALRRSEFAPLLRELVRDPGRDWSVEEMARHAHMSRASFFKHFMETCGQPPAQFVLLLRMKLAAQFLERGESVTRAAEHVGYRSYAAFSRAFKRVNGEQPGAYQRARRARESHLPSRVVAPR